MTAAGPVQHVKKRPRKLIMRHALFSTVVALVLHTVPVAGLVWRLVYEMVFNVHVVIAPLNRTS